MVKEKESQEIKTPDVSRRSFLSIVWSALGILAIFEFTILCVGFFRPKDTPDETKTLDTIIDAGPVEKYEPDSVTAFLRGRFYLSRLQDGGFLAISRRCSHLGCTVPWVKEKNQFICPCHGSAFDITGSVVRPPAPNALDLYPVTIENNRVRVNISRKITRSEFNNSQVTIPAFARMSKS